jgi:tripartite-type tricarboxylate transporter receptor subunit TctC
MFMTVEGTMDISRRQFSGGAATAGAALFAPRLARAQAWPVQDVHFICAFPAGSGADVIVRWYADRLRPIFNRTVIVENKVGAIGNLATEYAARSKPDGYTIYVHGASAVAANMHLFRNPTIDASKAITIAATLNRQPTMLMVAPDKPWKTVAELTAYLREKKDKATYATTNPVGKVMGAIYKQHEKLDAVEVVYRTGVDSLNDFASGAVDYGLLDNIFAAAQERAGRLRILAVSTPQRLEANPNIPTMTEQGVPMSLTGWFSAMVPSATPRPIVDQINKMFNQVTVTDDARKFLNNVASDPWITTPDEAQSFLLKEIKDWGDYVRLAKIEPQG